MRVKKPPIHILQKRRIQPTRMAQKWKLVPTPRHKQCPNTMCEVYIGNGCRKCPKCGTEQPVKKRKRKTADIDLTDMPEGMDETMQQTWKQMQLAKKNKKARTPKKKIVESPDGSPNTYYPNGSNVKVFWPRKNRWTWGIVESKFVPPAVSSHNANYLYCVKLLGLNGASWFLNAIPPTHLKKRRTTDVGQKGPRQRKDVVYEEITNLMNWSSKFIPGEKYKWHQLNAEETFKYLSEYNLAKNEKPQDWPIWECGKKAFPSCACAGCIIKYVNTVVGGPSEIMHEDLSDLRVGSIIRWERYNDYDKLAQVVSLHPCINPWLSQVRLKNADDTTRWSGKIMWRRGTSSHKEGWGGFLLHNICFVDGTERPYYTDAALKIYKQMVNLVRKRGLLEMESTTTFKLNTNNFTYNIDLKVTFPMDLGKVKWTGVQTNTETGVKRQMVIKALEKPRTKQLSDFKNEIIKKIGNHDFTWMDYDEAIKDPLLRDCIHPTNRRFLGMVRFNQPFVDIRRRSSEYSKFNVPHDIKRVYHGTYARNLFPILHPMGGFAMAKESNGKAYGQGIYFANSPDWVVDQGYAPTTNFNGFGLKCIIGAEIIASKNLCYSTDTWHRNASVREQTSSVRSSSPTSRNSNTIFDGKKFEVTGGTQSRSIHVVWYDRCKTDINITHVLWYK